MSSSKTGYPHAESYSIYEALQQEAIRNGASLDRDAFDIRNIANMGYGLIAKQKLQADHALFEVPQAYILAEETSNLREILPEGAWTALSHGWARLIMCMMWETELGAKSRWAAYLRAMPDSFETPMFWTEAELEQLKGTDLESRVGRSQAESDYTDVVKPVLLAHPDIFPPESPNFTLHAYHVQGSRILSRSFTVSATRVDPRAGEDRDDDSDSDSEDEDDSRVVMIPLADMLNAAASLENAHLQEGSESYSMVTTREINEGSQIYNTYDSPPNSEVLRKYGHVDELPLTAGILSCLEPEEIGEWPCGNPFDEVEIRGDAIVDALVELKVGTAAAIQPRVDWWLEEGNDDTFGLLLGEEVDTSMISFCRLLTSEADWERARFKGKQPRPVMSSSVAELIDVTLKNRLSCYPTALEGDLADLQSGLSGRRRAAAIVRVGEMRILRAARRKIKEIRGGKDQGGEDRSRKRPRSG